MHVGLKGLIHLFSVAIKKSFEIYTYCLPDVLIAAAGLTEAEEVDDGAGRCSS